MSKAVRMAKVSAKGGFNLFLGIILSSIISAVGMILMVRLLTPQEYGLYTIAFVSPATISLFSDLGINPAMTRYLAQYRSENRTTEMRSILASGILFESALGTLLSITSFSLAGFLATNAFHRPETKLLIEIASISMLAGSLLITSQSVFIGFERMEFNSLTMILKSLIKALLAPLLVFLGYGALGAILGHTIALLTAGALGILILYIRP